MSRVPVVAVVVVVAVAQSLIVVAGCKKKESGTAAGGGSAATGSAATGSAAGATADAGAPAADAAPEPDAPEDADAARRAGKKTGLGAPDEPVEVATEDLIKAIGEKKLDPTRLIDPARGVYEIWNMPGAAEKSPPRISKRHCGKKATALVVKEAASWLARQKRYPDEPDMYLIECSNEFVTTEDPTFGAIDEEGEGDEQTPPKKPGRPLKYAVCAQPGAGEYDDNPSIYFVPDATGQLRIAGILTTEIGAMDYAEVNELSEQLAKPGKLCK